MPSLQSFIRLLAVVLALSLPFGARADDVQDINQLFRKGDLNGALSRANQFLAKNPKDAQVRFLKGLILADQGKSAEAIQVFTTITEDYPELPEPYNNLAVLYAAEGKYDAAQNALEMAIRTHPSYATAHENLGDLYAKMASQAYDKALQIDSSNKAAQTKLALIKEMMSGKPQRPPVAQPNSKPAPATAQSAAPAPSAVPPNSKPVTAAAQPDSKPAPEVTIQSVVPAAQPVSIASTETRKTEPLADKNPNIVETVQSWAKAWSSKNVEAYLAHYSPDFSPSNLGHGEWTAQRRERIAASKFITVIARDIKVKRVAPDRATASFVQYYKSDRLANTSSKTLDLVLMNGRWLIVRESGR